MKLTAVIRKINLSNFANSLFWGKFDRLLELPFSDEQFLKLIEFFQAIAEYRTFSQETLSRADGFNFRFFTNDENPLVAYQMFGLRDFENMISILRDNEIFEDYKSKRDAIYAELGWVFEEERAIEIECDFEESNLEWSNLPSTFSEAESLYNAATIVVGDQQ